MLSQKKLFDVKFFTTLLDVESIDVVGEVNADVLTEINFKIHYKKADQAESVRVFFKQLSDPHNTVITCTTQNMNTIIEQGQENALMPDFLTEIHDAIKTYYDPRTNSVIIFNYILDKLVIITHEAKDLSLELKFNKNVNIYYRLFITILEDYKISVIKDDLLTAVVFENDSFNQLLLKKDLSLHFKKAICKILLGLIFFIVYPFKLETEKNNEKNIISFDKNTCKINVKMKSIVEFNTLISRLITFGNASQSDLKRFTLLHEEQIVVFDVDYWLEIFAENTPEQDSISHKYLKYKTKYLALKALDI